MNFPADEKINLWLNVFTGDQEKVPKCDNEIVISNYYATILSQVLAGTFFYLVVPTLISHFFTYIVGVYFVTLNDVKVFASFQLHVNIMTGEDSPTHKLINPLTSCQCLSEDFRQNYLPVHFRDKKDLDAHFSNDIISRYQAIQTEKPKRPSDFITSSSSLGTPSQPRRPSKSVDESLKELQQVVPRKLTATQAKVRYIQYAYSLKTYGMVFYNMTKTKEEYVDMVVKPKVCDLIFFFFVIANSMFSLSDMILIFFLGSLR